MSWSTSGPQRCAYCGNVGARTIVALGWAHRRCIPKVSKKKAKYKGPPDGVKREPAFQDPDDAELGQIVCPKCQLQPIEPFGEWQKMSCYCGFVIENKPENRADRGLDSDA